MKVFFCLKFNGMNETIKFFWKSFIINNPRYVNEKIPESFYFCDNEKDANDCAKLVIQKEKQATAPSLWSFEVNNEELPKVGELNIVTDWNRTPIAIIITTEIKLTPYNKINIQFAVIEGEGDKSLNYWKRVHKDYYTREMKESQDNFSEDMIIVCQYFKTIYI